MKKSILSILLAGASIFGAAAQNDGAPNRMLVIDRSGAYSAFHVSNVDNISFATVDGPVAAEIQLHKFSTTSIELTVQRTPNCEGFLINVIPAVIARQLNEANGGSYLETLNSPGYFEDFENGTLSGLQLNDATEYAIVTVGIDKYNVYCDLERAYFTTGSKPLVGNPEVKCEVTKTGLYSITAEFDANNDVKGYSYVISEKGTMEAQFEQFAGMFGFANMGEMIKAWGVENAGGDTSSYTWNDLSPNTKYEIYIQAWDKNGTFAPMKIVETATLSKGGDGESFVTITPGEYKLEDWGGEMLPSQFFTFTPNDQTSAYRFGVYYADEYNADPQGIKDNLCKDPEMPVAYYFFYEPLTTDFQINPATDIVVIAAGKNISNAWGSVNELKYTTPAKAAAIAKSTGIVPRIVPVKSPIRKGMMPSVGSINPALNLSK